MEYVNLYDGLHEKRIIIKTGERLSKIALNYTPLPPMYSIKSPSFHIQQFQRENKVIHKKRPARKIRNSWKPVYVFFHQWPFHTTSVLHKEPFQVGDFLSITFKSCVVPRRYTHTLGDPDNRDTRSIRNSCWSRQDGQLWLKRQLSLALN